MDATAQDVVRPPVTTRRKARRACRRCGRRVLYLFGHPRLPGLPGTHCRGCARRAGWPVKYAREDADGR